MRTFQGIVLILTLVWGLTAFAADAKTTELTPQQHSGVSKSCSRPGLSEHDKGTLLAGRGCCSHHKGQCGCRKGRVECCDGTLSPSCRCEADSRLRTSRLAERLAEGGIYQK